MFSQNWTYSWDTFKMQLYIGSDSTGQDKIFVSVAEVSESGQQVPLYERELCLLNPDIIRGLERMDWEERQLRWFTETHPNLIELEKAFLRDWFKRKKSKE